MTKQEFVDRVADKAGLSKRDAAEAVDAFLDSITDVLRSGGECIHGIREVHDPSARRAPGRQPEESNGASPDPGNDRPQVLGRQSAQAGREERRGDDVALRQHWKFREGAAVGPSFMDPPKARPRTTRGESSALARPRWRGPRGGPHDERILRRSARRGRRAQAEPASGRARPDARAPAGRARGRGGPRPRRSRRRLRPLLPRRDRRGRCVRGRREAAARLLRGARPARDGGARERLRVRAHGRPDRRRRREARRHRLDGAGVCVGLPGARRGPPADARR